MDRAPGPGALPAVLADAELVDTTPDVEHAIDEAEESIAQGALARFEGRD